jgi:chromosome segregation ATPase
MLTPFETPLIAMAICLTFALVAFGIECMVSAVCKLKVADKQASDYDDLQEVYDALYQEDEELCKELEDLQNRYAELENQNAGLSTQVEALQSAALEDATEIDNLNGEITVMNDRMDIFKTEIAPLLFAEFSSVLSDLVDRAIQVLGKANKGLQQSVQLGLDLETTLRDRNHSLHQELGVMNEQLVECRQKNDCYREELLKAQQTITALQSVRKKGR